MTWSFDAEAAREALAKFFDQNHRRLADYGRTVNQVFEAFVFSRLVEHYRDAGWQVALHHPGGRPDAPVRLKFSTRGAPKNYTYARATRNGASAIQIRHGLRVATWYHVAGEGPPANIVLDVSVIADCDLTSFKTDDFLDNAELVTFGEAKHMSAYAELVANFMGLVHEMQPHRLVHMSKGKVSPGHTAPFLYVSGHLYHTGRGVKISIERRELDVAIYSASEPMP